MTHSIAAQSLISRPQPTQKLAYAEAAVRQRWFSKCYSALPRRHDNASYAKSTQSLIRILFERMRSDIDQMTRGGEIKGIMLFRKFGIMFLNVFTLFKRPQGMLSKILDAACSLASESISGAVPRGLSVRQFDY